MTHCENTVCQHWVMGGTGNTHMREPGTYKVGAPIGGGDQSSHP